MPDVSPVRRRLGRQDWIDAALQALTDRGPEAVAIEPLASALGATKGSGYWHFANRAALVEATMDEWLRLRTDEIISRVEQDGGSARDRLSRLLAVVSTGVERAIGESSIMSSVDPVVRQRMQVAVGRRIDYLTALLEQSGLARGAARSRAVLAYATFSGHAVLAVTVPEVLPNSPQARRRAHREMLEMVLGPTPV
ncbi:MAG: TetR/AcrR family transcriptional regulator [Nakamurella sp.]